VKGYTHTGKGYTHTYTYAYAGWDSYREKTVGATLDDRLRTFAYDGNGMILSRRDGTVTSGNVFQQKNAQGQVATGDVLGRMGAGAGFDVAWRQQPHSRQSECCEAAWISRRKERRDHPWSSSGSNRYRVCSKATAFRNLASYARTHR